MNYKEAFKKLVDSVDKKYKITSFEFDLPDMFVFGYENKNVSYGSPCNYFAVSKETKEVILDLGIIFDSMDKIPDGELSKYRKSIFITQTN